jgi:hypothetical protein
MALCLFPLLGCGNPINGSGTPAAATTEAPTFSVADGCYYLDQSVKLSCSTSGASIYYTTDGITAPTASSTLYSDSAPISVAGSGSAKTIQAIAVKSGMSDSAVASAAISVRDLYMAGRNNNGWGKWTPYVWKNDTTTNLSMGSGGANAYAIGFSGSDIYAVGDSSGPGYWKNGSYTSLSLVGSGGTRGGAKAIAFSGGDVYMAGYSEVYGTYVDTACYWKNGVCNPLSGTNSWSRGIAIAGDGSAYCVGQMQVSGVWQPYYWKATSSTPGGTATALSALGGSADAVAISSGSVYIVGSVVNSSGVTVPCYWKDGARIDLSPERSFGGEAAALTFADGLLYIAGYTKDTAVNGEVPCYWKMAASTTRVDLPVGQPRGMTSGIAVSGGTVYVSGYYGPDIDTAPAYPVPCFWRNGVRTNIPLGTQYAGMPTAIAFGN